MSDTSQGPGYWRASDGKWYPPQARTEPRPPGPPAPGYWQATKLVNDDIAPGRYIATDVDLCYWERLRGIGGEFDDIIANDNVSGQAIVAIAPTDVAFNSNDCGRWQTFVPTAAPSDSFGEGDYAVNAQIQPGRYRSDGTGSCYWERLSNFSGEGIDGIIANSNVEGSAIVDIAPTDVGFSSSGCGAWTKVG